MRLALYKTKKAKNNFQGENMNHQIYKQERLFLKNKLPVILLNQEAK